MLLTGRRRRRSRAMSEARASPTEEAADRSAAPRACRRRSTSSCQVTAPAIDASCSARFSTAGRPSRRAATRSLSPVGTISRDARSASAQLVPTRTRAPRSTSIRALSSRNSGFPAARSTSRRTTSSGKSPPIVARRIRAASDRGSPPIRRSGKPRWRSSGSGLASARNSTGSDQGAAFTSWRKATRSGSAQ